MEITRGSARCLVAATTGPARIGMNCLGTGAGAPNGLCTRGGMAASLAALAGLLGVWPRNTEPRPGLENGEKNGGSWPEAELEACTGLLLGNWRELKPNLLAPL